LSKLGFFGDFPFAVLVDGDEDGNANDGEERGEEQFAQAETVVRFGRRGHRRSFAHAVSGQKEEKT
jgi:hypothetical protein